MDGTHQKSRLNIFIEPAQRHQIDALAAETGQPLATIVRELFAMSLPDLHHRVQLWTNPLTQLSAELPEEYLPSAETTSRRETS